MTGSQDFMTLALQLAERGRFTVSPNPMVGCVIVKNNQIVGQGFHVSAGLTHAEINALENAGPAAQNANMYVTLEPCCHYGRTPPCVSAIINAGISKVYIACLDPNPKVAGQGIAALKAAGIEVHVGLCEDEAKKLNKIFFHYITHQRPYIIAKWAMSLDGKTITHPVDSRDISCPASRSRTHETRHAVDAILVGANTAIHDNPLLTVRTNEPSNVKHPIRIVLSSHGKLPANLKMFAEDMPAKTIIATTDEYDTATIISNNVEFIRTKKNMQGKVDLAHLLDELGAREITSLLVEGGMTVHESFFNEDLINEYQVYIAPVIIGSMQNKKLLTNLQMQPIDRDYFLIGS